MTPHHAAMPRKAVSAELQKAVDEMRAMLDEGKKAEAEVPAENIEGSSGGGAEEKVASPEAMSDMEDSAEKVSVAAEAVK
jgi:hypothetical protein